MTNLTVSASRNFYAKLAGFTILFYIAVGFTSVVLYSGATNAEGNNAILMRIGGHITAMRATIILELLESFSAIVLAVTLYGVTRSVNNEIAMLGLVCRVCEGIMGALGIRSTLGLLWLANAGTGTDSLDPATVNSLSAFLLMPSQSAMIGATFFAVGSLMFSYLMLRGRLVPTILAKFGVFASVLLVVGVPLQLAGILNGPVPRYMWLPMIAFQFTLGLWLIIKGIAEPIEKQST